MGGIYYNTVRYYYIIKVGYEVVYNLDVQICVYLW